MKKIICVLFFTITFFSVNAQEKIEDVLITGKWYLESTQESGEEPEISEDKTDESWLFTSDGKVVHSDFGEITTYNWKYLVNKKVIQITATETVYHRVLEISKDKLVVEVTDALNEAHLSIETYVK